MPINKHWPLFAAIGVLWVSGTLLVITAVTMNQGHLIYPLDDAYIHMAMAKNFALHHVWGVTKYGFTSSTSSPLWTILLAAAYFVFGVNDAAPLIFNLLFGTLAVVVAYCFLQKISSRPHQLTTAAILISAVVAAPLPTLTVIGMEHTLHACLMLCFVYLSVMVMSNVPPHPKGNLTLLAISASLLTACRYEGLFVAFVVGVLLLIRKRIIPALIFGAAALLPVVVYGFISVAHGTYFFPNSVLLKGQLSLFSLHGNYAPWKFGALSAIGSSRPLLFLLITSLFLLAFSYIKKQSTGFVGDSRRYTQLIFAGTLLLHMQFADAGWFYRYEAYLVLLGIIATGIPLFEIATDAFRIKFGSRAGPYYAAIMLLMIAFLAPFGRRAAGAIMQTPQAAHNTYGQHYQMGRFISQYYQGQSVVVNDIGAVTYLADIRLFDLCGLGSLSTARLQLSNRYTYDDFNRLFLKQGARVGVFYDSLLFTSIGGKNPDWTRVGQWEIPRNIIAADSKISFYGFDSTGCDELELNLRSFSPELPADVKQYGRYAGK